MPAFAPIAIRAHRHPLSAEDPRDFLAEARESLAYWEERAETLPLRQVRKRREARELADRWHARVADAEKAAYGAGALGLVALLLAERRLPQSTRRTGRTVARRASQAAVVLAVCVIGLLAAGAVAIVEILLAILRALG
jgi:hypothetical protein